MLLVPVAGLEPARLFLPCFKMSKSLKKPTYMILLTRAHVMRYRYATFYGKHPQEKGKPNWFCATTTPKASAASVAPARRTPKSPARSALTVERAAALTRQGKLSNEKALKLVRETCDAIAETHGKLAANRAEAVLKPAVEEFIRIAGGEFTSYTVRGWLESWIAGRTDASKATVIEYRRIIEMFLKFLGARADRALTTLQPRQIEDFQSQSDPCSWSIMSPSTRGFLFISTISISVAPRGKTGYRWEPGPSRLPTRAEEPSVRLSGSRRLWHTRPSGRGPWTTASPERLRGTLRLKAQTQGEAWSSRRHGRVPLMGDPTNLFFFERLVPPVRRVTPVRARVTRRGTGVPIAWCCRRRRSMSVP